jgi:hypothetical protein
MKPQLAPVKPRQFAGQRMQLRRVRMLFGNIAQENRALLAFDQAGGDGLAGRTWARRIEPFRNRFVLQLRSRLDDRLPVPKASPLALTVSCACS